MQLKRAARELELQRSLMGKGAKEVVRAKGDRKAGEDEWWLQGVKGARKGKGGASAEQEEGKLPMAEEGVATGARVWVRLYLPLTGNARLTVPCSPALAEVEGAAQAVVPPSRLSQSRIPCCPTSSRGGE